MKSGSIIVFIGIGLFACFGSARIVELKNKLEIKILYPQETHQHYTIAYLDKANVKERITWSITGTDSSRISVDRFDGAGHKIEAIEYYEGDRKLEKFIDGEWRQVNTITRFTFQYDALGRQVLQYNHDFNPENWNELYKYDRYGNLERWETGRSFQLPRLFICEYDSLHQIVFDYRCWEMDTCMRPDQFMRPYYKHYLKYNADGRISEDLGNYVDGMWGWVYTYEKNKTGQIITITKTRVWSYFGLDHEIPTLKDVDQKLVYTTWEFEYDTQGKLKKEIRTDEWIDKDEVYTLEYNSNGLISRKTSRAGLTDYVYNQQGLLVEELHYSGPDTDKKLFKRLHFQYVYQ